MKNNDNEIRKLLKDAIDYKADYAYGYIIKKCKEALALLPCETCNGTGIKPNPHDGDSCIICAESGGDCRVECPCPDCK
jgi:hypothetical protein